MLLAALISMTSLAAGTARSDAMGANPTQFVVTPQCPPLKNYTAGQAKQLGEARKRLRAVEPDSILLTTSDDYLTLRKQCRAIENKGP